MVLNRCPDHCGIDAEILVRQDDPHFVGIPELLPQRWPGFRVIPIQPPEALPGESARAVPVG